MEIRIYKILRNLLNEPRTTVRRYGKSIYIYKLYYTDQIKLVCSIHLDHQDSMLIDREYNMADPDFSFEGLAEDIRKLSVAHTTICISLK